jgi:hypothetical protein
MFNRLSKSLWPIMLGLICAGAAQAQPVPSSLGAPDTGYAQAAEGPQRLDFSRLGAPTALRLRGEFAQYSLPFAVREDQYVREAGLALKVAYSPQLDGQRSQLRVFLNDEVVAATRLVDLPQSGLWNVALDPALFVVYNDLRFELLAADSSIGSDSCLDPLSPALWLEVAQSSVLALDLGNLPLAPDLGRLPAPFVSAADSRRVRLNMVLPHNAGTQTLRAAVTLASWLGMHADYRGLEIVVRQAELPAKGHVIVLQNSVETRRSLSAASMNDGPTVQIQEHPLDAAAQMLVVSGASPEQMLLAAQGLAYGHSGMSGTQARIVDFAMPEPRPMFASPRWLDTEDDIQLTTLIDEPLSVRGLNAGPLQIDFRLPPDLYFFSTSEPRLHFDYRASVAAAKGSSLSVLLNGQFADQVAVNRRDDGRATRAVTSLPPTQLTHRNQLSWQFNFVKNTNQPCQAYDSNSWEGSVDRNIRMVLPRHAHFAELPDLSKLRNGGYPFSRAVDGAQMALIIGQQPSAPELSAALTLAAYLGRESGVPLWHAEVYTDSPSVLELDKDLLVVGTLSRLQVLDEMQSQLPLSRQGKTLQLRRPSLAEQVQAWLEERDLEAANAYAGKVLLESQGQLAAFMQIQSPTHAERSVVVVAAEDPVSLPVAARTLLDPGRAQYLNGDLALVNTRQVSSFDLGPRYGVGHLPWDQRVLRWLQRHPYSVVPMMLLTVLLFVLCVRLGLRRRDG